MNILLFLPNGSGILSSQNFSTALSTAQKLAETGSSTCLNIAYSMLAVHLFWTIINVIVFQGGWDFMNVLRVIALIFFISFYNELSYSIIWTADSISNIFGAKEDVLNSLGKITTGSLKKGEISLLGINTEIPFNDFTGFLGWLMSKIQEGLSLAVRILIGRLQILLIGFMYVAGIFSAAFSTIPGFSSSFSHWLKGMVNVLLWSLTLAILDSFVIVFFDAYVPDKTDISSEMIDAVIYNLSIILMYISVPLLTTMYLGAGGGASGIVSRLTSTAGGVASGGASVASKKVGGLVKAGAGKAADFGKGVYDKMRNSASRSKS